MSKFADYADRFETIRMDRRDGIIQLTFHTDGGPLHWGAAPHHEFPEAFRAVGNDRENKVVILTGTGEIFSTRLRGAPGWFKSSPRVWYELNWADKHLLLSLLDIEVPMISAINGPCLVHSEFPLLSDIVLASDDASFQDAPHFINGFVPGDGVEIVYEFLLGPNRVRYFLLTGQTLSVQQAHDLGLVAEVMPRADLLPRAWELAEQLTQRNPLLLRYTRVLLTQPIKRALLDRQGYSLALESLAALDRDYG